MNYSKIRVLQARTNLSNVKFADSIGMSDVGYNKMLDKETCTVEKLEEICKVYDLPISYFFDDKSSKVSEPQSRYGKCEDCIKKDAKIELLSEQLEKKDQEIILLHRQLERIEPGEKAQVG